jgi:glutaconate CoA-transferase subunit B
MTLPYSASELMCVNAARLLRDGDVVFVGVGLPNLACNLARRTHAPNLQMIYEAGVIGARPARLPLSIGDPTLVSGAASVCGMYDIFTLYLQRGNVDVGFLGGAQVDRFGNINATVIGDYAIPRYACLVRVGRKRWAAGPTAATSSPAPKAALPCESGLRHLGGFFERPVGA